MTSSSSPKDSLKRELMRRLLEARKDIPTSAIGRLGRTAATALRSGRLMLGARGRADRAASGAGEARETDIDIDEMARIVASIGELKGIAMKAGQIMSYIDVALPEELRDALSVLQTHAQPMPIERVEGILRDELGDRAAELLRTLEPEPVAAASIGQVHRARLADGTVVAVKVQYLNIERAIEADFGPAAVGTRLISLIYPNARADTFVREARARFLEECDYLHEAHYQRRFGAIFAAHPLLRVPAVHGGLCSRRVLTTTFVQGASFDAFLSGQPPQAVRDRIGEALFEFYIGTLFLGGLYNCDPHPGNYLFLPDGAVAMLDYGCTREFEPAFVAKLAALTRAVHGDERDALHRSFVDLGMVKDGQRYDFDTARGLVRAFYGPMLRAGTREVDLGEVKSMRQVLDSKRELMKLGVPGEFLFLFRIRFGLMSVLARLGARADWYELEQAYVSRGGPA